MERQPGVQINKDGPEAALQGSPTQDAMEIDQSWTPVPATDRSIAPSLITDKGKRRPTSISDGATVLFWINTCIAQWKLINLQTETALKERKTKATNTIGLAASLLIKEREKIADLQSEADLLSLSHRSAAVADQLSQPLDSFSHIKSCLIETVKTLETAVTSALERVPLVDGAVIGEADNPDLTTLMSYLASAETSLSSFGETLDRLIRPRSRSPSPRRQPRPTPLDNMEATSAASADLENAIKEEIELIKEVASLLEEKNKKQLKLNTMRTFNTLATSPVNGQLFKS